MSLEGSPKENSDEEMQEKSTQESEHSEKQSQNGEESPNKNSILLVLPLKKISLQPDFSSLPWVGLA